MEKQIAIMIPTMNRSQYLELALAFYHQVQFKGMIYIGDSSEGEHKDKVKALCEHYGNNGLNIKGFSFPAIHEGIVMDIVNQQLDRKIKYCCFAGDDDFALPNGLVKCAEFLEDNHNYVAAHGHRANFTYQENGKSRLTNICYGYDWDEESTPESRWHEYMRVGIAVTNYLHRKDVWKKKFAHCHEVPSRYLGPELLPESVVSLSGPVKFLDDTVSYLFYEKNPDRDFSFEKYTLWELMNRPEWHPSLMKVREVISQYVEPEFMERELWFHFMAVLHNQYINRFGQPAMPPRNDKLNNLDSEVLWPPIIEALKLITEIVNLRDRKNESRDSELTQEPQTS